VAENTILTGWQRQELLAAKARLEAEGLSEEEVARQLKLLAIELQSSNSGASTYGKDKKRVKAVLDQASDY
jgi:hypothetical protein